MSELYRPPMTIPLGNSFLAVWHRSAPKGHISIGTVETTAETTVEITLKNTAETTVENTAETAETAESTADTAETVFKIHIRGRNS